MIGETFLRLVAYQHWYFFHGEITVALTSAGVQDVMQLILLSDEHRTMVLTTITLIIL